MKNMKHAQTFRLFPGRWFGVVTPYHPAFVEHLKHSQPVKAWDSFSKTWWFPEGRAPIVCADTASYNLADATEVAQFLTLLRGTSQPGFKAPAAISAENRAYTTLGLQTNAPRELVELAYEYWAREYRRAGGMEMQALEVEMAYKHIIGNAG